MAARRGKSQARRNGGSSGGLPGWAWMIIGIVLTIAVVMLAPRLLKSDGEDGFYRPRANPDALPAPTTGDDDAAPPTTGPTPRPSTPAADAPLPDTAPDYDFYTLLPGQEVPMTDAELAASARAEEARQRDAARRREDAAEPAAPDRPPATATTPPDTAAPTPGAAPSPGTQDASARYLLQAGSFSASGDAEALKARIALLGLSARVESGTANGRTVYRVRMGPYGSATELAEAKGRLEGGGLPAMAIRVQ